MDGVVAKYGPQLPESAIITCKSDGYLPVSGGQLALVMAKVTTMNHCGQNTADVLCVIPISQSLPHSVIAGNWINY